MNESGFLRDPTGARRFWVIPVKSIDFKAFESINKDLLWAQAYDLYINGEKWWFDDTDKDINKELQRLHNAHKAYSVADDLFNEIERLNSREQYMNVSSIFDLFGSKSATKKDMNDLATLLESSGYKRNSRKEFLVPTKYKPQSSTPLKSGIDLSEFDFDDSDDSEGINDLIEAINK